MYISFCLSGCSLNQVRRVLTGLLSHSFIGLLMNTFQKSLLVLCMVGGSADPVFRSKCNLAADTHFHNKLDVLDPSLVH